LKAGGPPHCTLITLPVFWTIGNQKSHQEEISKWENVLPFFQWRW